MIQETKSNLRRLLARENEHEAIVAAPDAAGEVVVRVEPQAVVMGSDAEHVEIAVRVGNRLLHADDQPLVLGLVLVLQTPFATDCKARFEKGDAFKKKEILSRLGSHLSLKGGFIDIDLENTLIPIKLLVKENKRLEPLKISKNREQIEQIYAQDARMLCSPV